MQLPEGKTREILVRYGDWIAVITLIAVVLVLSLPKIRGPIDLRYDGSVYYILGTSLAQGQGYRLLNEPGAIEAIQYPPLLPAFIALNQLLLDSDDPFVVGQALRITYHILYLAFVLFTFVLARRFVSITVALSVGLISALNVYSYFLADLCFTEIPYALLTIIFLLLVDTKWRVTTLLCGVIASAAYLLKTSGIALLAAWILEAVFERNYRACLIRGIIIAVPVLAWQAHIWHVKSSQEYNIPAYGYQRAPWQFYNVTYADNLALVDPYSPELGTLDAKGMIQRITNNMFHLPLELGEGTTVPKDTWRWPVFLILSFLPVKIGDHPWDLIIEATIAGPLLAGILVMAGFVVMLRSRERLAVVYVLLSLGLICMTPWPEQKTRYLMPLISLLALALIRGTITVVTWMTHRWSILSWIPPTNVLSFILLMIIAVQVTTTYWTYTYAHQPVELRDRHGSIHHQRLFYYDQRWQGYERALRWLDDHVDQNAIISTTCPPYLHLRIGRRAVMPPFESQPDRCLTMLENVPVDYVVVDGLNLLRKGGQYAEPALKTAPDHWSKVFDDLEGEVRIYRRMTSTK